MAIDQYRIITLINAAITYRQITRMVENSLARIIVSMQTASNEELQQSIITIFGELSAALTHARANYDSTINTERNSFERNQVRNERVKIRLAQARELYRREHPEKDIKQRRRVTYLNQDRQLVPIREYEDNTLTTQAKLLNEASGEHKVPPEAQAGYDRMLAEERAAKALAEDIATSTKFRDDFGNPIPLKLPLVGSDDTPEDDTKEC